MPFNLDPCSCIASQIVYNNGGSGQTTDCPNCLQIASAVIACADSVGPCGASGTVDLAALNDVTACKDNAGAQCAVTYAVISYDTVALSAASIDVAGELSFTTTDDATPDTFVQVRYRVDCACDDVLSAQGVIRICIKDLCNAVVCDAGETCDPCDGTCVPDIDVEID